MSALRTYRYLEVPGPHKLETIYLGLTLSRWFMTCKVSWSFLNNWGLLGLPTSMLQFRPKDINQINPYALWSPGSIDLKTFRASGPNGQHLWGRVVDLYMVRRSPILVCLLETFLKLWLTVLHLPEIPGAIRGPRGLMN